MSSGIEVYISFTSGCVNTLLSSLNSSIFLENQAEQETS